MGRSQATSGGWGGDGDEVIGRDRVRVMEVRGDRGDRMSELKW